MQVTEYNPVNRPEHFPGAADVERGAIPVGNMASGRLVEIPYMIKRGRKGGPCLWVNAAVHGDEVNGVFAAQRFFESVDSADLKGTIIVTPVSNVLALDERRKTTAFDGIDMDQSFPGRSNGFVTERSAAKLFERFGSDADVVVNIHTLGTPFSARPYAVYKVHDNGNVPESRILELIACFAPTVACRMPVGDAPGELRGNIAGALDYQVMAKGGIGFMIELGGGGRLENDLVDHGVAGLHRLLHKLGMSSRHIGGTASHVKRVTARAHMLAQTGGLFEPAVTAGVGLAAGASLGTIRNVFGDVLIDIKIATDSWVIAVRRDPVVHCGDRIAFLGSAWGDVAVGT